MAVSNETVFSEFFLDQVGFKLPDDDSATLVDCVGKLVETMNTKTITKSCRGRVKKSRTKGSDGTVEITLHMPYELYRKIYGMGEYATGVYGYGTESMHQELILTAKVKDEDDNVMYKAYPVAVCNTKESTIDDDATEVPMVDLTFTVTADDNEVIVYQALESDITDDNILTNWMANWTTDLVSAVA